MIFAVAVAGAWMQLLIAENVTVVVARIPPEGKSVVTPGK